MTREQAEKEIRDTFTEVWANGIIKALEQEPIIDKIRAEIEEIQTYDGIYIDRAYVLEILDKHRAESEG